MVLLLQLQGSVKLSKVISDPDTSTSLKGHEHLSYLFRVLKGTLDLGCFTSRLPSGVMIKTLGTGFAVVVSMDGLIVSPLSGLITESFREYCPT